MFHSMVAAITSFFLSLVQQPVQQHSPTTPLTHTAQMERSSSYFYYDREDHIRVHLEVGENKGIVSSTVEKRYFFQGDISVEGCLIEQIDPDIHNKIEITDKKYIDFGVQFVAPCNAQKAIVKGEKIIQNSVTTNGKKFNSVKKEAFGPVVISNKILDSLVSIQLLSSDQSLTLQSQELKSFIIKIVDKNGAQIDPQKIASVTIRSLDSTKLKFRDSNGELSGVIKIDTPKDSSITIEAQSVGRAGSVGLEVAVRILGTKTPFTVKKEFALLIKKAPVVDVQIVLEPQQQTLMANKVYYIHYSFKNADELLNADEIYKLFIEVKNAKIIYQNRELQTLTLSMVKSSGTFYIKPLKAGQNLQISMRLYLRNGKIVTKKLLLSVVDLPLAQISINPVNTIYKPEENMYQTQFIVHVQDAQPFEKFSVDVITPKILYPSAYYDSFIKGTLDYENKYVFYNGIKKGNYSGKIEKGYQTLFSSSFYDLHQVAIGEDRLIILPNKYVNDKSLLGNWDIVDISSDKLVLAQEAQKTQDRLSFVLGSEVRYDPIHYTLATMTLDSLDHNYIVDENGSFIFTLTYPPFMTGKDIFVGIHKVESGKRVGNSFKFTLQGTGLTYPEEFTCADKSVCVWRITINQKDSGERLTYTRIEHNCQVNKGSYNLLTSYKRFHGGCNSYLKPRELKTDEKGYIYLCIFPSIKYKEVETNETSGGGNTLKVPDGYEEATVKCKFNVDEEFPY